MGKLINAEKLNDKIDKEECRRREPAWYDGLDTCREIIDEIPAVDAIPVNWISSYMNQAYGRVRAEIIREMLNAWMEQEG